MPLGCWLKAAFAGGKYYESTKGKPPRVITTTKNDEYCLPVLFLTPNYGTRVARLRSVYIDQNSDGCNILKLPGSARVCNCTSITMLPACRTAPGIAVRTRPVPQRPGLLRVVAAVILGVLHDIFYCCFFVLFWVGAFCRSRLEVAAIFAP